PRAGPGGAGAPRAAPAARRRGGRRRPGGPPGGGGGAVSTRAICERAGVQAPTLYHHFGSRQKLLDAVVSHGFREHLAARQAQSLEDPGADVGDPVDAIREGWDAHVQFGLDHPASYAMNYGAVKPGVPCGVASEVEAMIRSTLEPAARAGRLRVTPAQAAAEIFSAGSGVTLALIQPVGEHDLGLSHRVREAILAAVTTGAVATADRGGDVSGGDGAAPAAVALGAALDASGRDGSLSPGEHALLRELLDRLAAG
ncbi:TetR/AcrR family transcriptional regulator, partial [Patulibacter sp. NPDC049589]|uniref:TetR/AcrR family transcriptional regulator n=1 Tax=Patulibacter sp. NPDC049589 TaxID=3154731 RepID=UPI003427AD3F